jgi:hypothetical protein
MDRAAALRFLETAYQPDDWIAVLLKSHETGRVAQRIVPVSLVKTPRLQAWLDRENHAGGSVYLTVNVIQPRRASRTRRAIAAVRHVFLDADHDAPRVLASLAARQDLPPPSYVLHSSPNRVHVFWRVAGFTTDGVEAMQKHLAWEFGTDPAATPCSQTTRLPGSRNHKYRPAWLVTMEYRDVDQVYTPMDFPTPLAIVRTGQRVQTAHAPAVAMHAWERARRYLGALPPAVSGQHGDQHTFRVCCRLVRGFALSDAEALAVLIEWNARCAPPWSERDLMDKLRHARRYGREPMGGLLEIRP